MALSRCGGAGSSETEPPVSDVSLPEDAATDAPTPSDVADTHDASKPPEGTCTPCQADADCEASARCVLMDGTAFCASTCGAGCPAGEACQSAAPVEGQAVDVCVPSGSACGCSAAAATTGALALCEIRGAAGACRGTRMCGQNGLSACTAPTPAAEICNGVDDDCDGTTDNVTCDDGDPCTKDDACTTGVCAGTPICADGDPCTADTCDPETLACTSTPSPDGAACQPLDPCLTAGVCAGGVCEGMTPTNCDDGNPCTSEDCAEGFGCVSYDKDGKCDDGDPCTIGDRCADSACAGSVDPTCTPGCGNGVCEATESCGACPADCSPLGYGACSGACDPTVIPTSCPANFLCAPSEGSQLALAILGSGNGVCGAACASDADCGGGVCLSGLVGLASAGLCGAACTPGGTDCAEGESCFAKPGGGGACVHGGGACALGDTEACPLGSACVGTAAGGLCLRACYASGSGCPEGTACIIRSDASAHEGTCIGQDPACGPVAQTGCGPAETCFVAADPSLTGVARVCRPAIGELAAGADCEESPNGCAKGLSCLSGRCRAYCDPSIGCGGPACTPLAEAPELGICTTTCGDEACDPGETCSGCPIDCGICSSICGDTACEDSETCVSCPIDCGECASCGDTKCNGDETCDDCPTDCGACLCGDNHCALTEDCASCPADCTAVCACGNTVCDATESCVTCPGDCGGCLCGDGTCQETEACGTCDADCGACVCGDGTCGPTEDCSSCPGDCGACSCGDAKCTTGEACGTCPGDCGECPCGDGVCDAGQDCVSCPADCGACFCGDGSCQKSESCETCSADCQACFCGNGSCDTDEACATCPQDCHVFGLTGCTTSCDPTIGGCPANYACGGVNTNTVFVGPLDLGNSVCAAACTGDGECGDDVCVRVRGIESPGVCAGGCDPAVAGSCAAGLDCVAIENGAPNRGACVQTCQPGYGVCMAGLSTCTALVANPSVGACLPACYQANAAACAEGTTCIIKTEPEYHAGVCVGQDEPCDPVAQTGCEAGETCEVVAGLLHHGITYACTDHVGPIAEGGACIPTVPDCQLGLSCVERICRKFCDPGGGGCPSGTACTDVSAFFYRPAQEIAVCK